MARKHDKSPPSQIYHRAKDSLLVGMGLGAVIAFGLFFAALAGSETAMVTFFRLATPAYNPFAFFMPSDLGVVSNGLELGLTVLSLFFGMFIGVVVFLWRSLMGRS